MDVFPMLLQNGVAYEIFGVFSLKRTKINCVFSALFKLNGIMLTLAEIDC